MEESRSVILKRVVDNLISENDRCDFFNKLIVFDNASTVPHAIDFLKKFPLVVQSDRSEEHTSELQSQR